MTRRRGLSILLLVLAIALGALVAWKVDFGRAAPAAPAPAAEPRAPREDPGESAPVPLPLAPAAEPAPRPVVGHAPTATALAPAAKKEAPPEEQGTGRIFGTVRGADGRPLEGVTVRAAGMPAKRSGVVVRVKVAKDKRASGGTRTGEDGTYAIEHLAAGDYVVSAEDGAHADLQSQATLAEGESRRLDFDMTEGAKVSGHVRDGAGAPLAAIEVSSMWPERHATSGADGAYAIGGLDPSGGAALTAHDPSGRMGDVNRYARAGETAADLVMRAAAQIAGRVVERKTGAPVAGAKVGTGRQVMGLGAEHAAESDQDGRFELAGLAPGAYKLQVTKEGFAPAAASVDAGEGERADVTVELGQGAAIAGRVLDAATGAGLAGAHVFDVTDLELGGGGAFSPETLVEMMAAQGGNAKLAGLGVPSSADSGDDGAYRLERVPPGARRLVAFEGGHESLARTIEVAADGADVRADFPLGGGGTIEGRVGDAAGAPVAEAQIMAMSPMVGARLGKSDAAGHYAIRGLKPGNYIVTLQSIADAKTDQREMRSAAVERGATVRVDFGPASRGTLVYGAVTGPLPPSRQLALLRAGQGIAGMRQVTISDDGTYRIEGVEPGAYDLAIHPAFHARVDVPPGTPEVRFDVTMPALALAGVVRSADGAPIADAKLWAGRASDRGDPLFSQMFRVAASTDQDGRFTLEGLEAVDYDVEATAPGYVHARRTVSLAGGAPAPIELRLAPGGVIHARVVGPDGSSVTAAFLMAEEAGSGRTYGGDATMMKFGGAADEVRLEGLPPGVYAVTAFSLRYAFDRRAGVRFDGSDLTLEFGLSPGGTLEVACRDESGAPVAGALMELRFPDGGRVLTPVMETFFAASGSGADGVARRDRLQAGTYRGTARARDGREASFEATVADGGTTRVAATLRAAIR